MDIISPGDQWIGKEADHKLDALSTNSSGAV